LEIAVTIKKKCAVDRDGRVVETGGGVSHIPGKPVARVEAVNVDKPIASGVDWSKASGSIRSWE
jgi:hypothetical protein